MKPYFIALLFFLFHLANSQTTSSFFDKNKMEYRGAKLNQAKLLMRKIKFFGNIEKKAPSFDSVFVSLINSNINLSKAKIRTYLSDNNLTENAFGGSMDNPVSFVLKNNNKIFAKYFVIHDVSAPVFENNFPANINDESWSLNNPNVWTQKVTHVYLTRTGKANTVVTFSSGLRATKFELKILGVPSRGLYLHVELIQPRKFPPGNKLNAPVAPEPGFTDIQYERLALLYLIASVRKGDWLVPAFHCVIDEGLNDGHDDPQNFDLDKFTNEIVRLNSKFSN